MNKVLHTIDAGSEWLGKIFSWSLLLIALIISTEVIMRYVFNRPTTISWDINVMLQGAVVAAGGAYVVLHGGHISVDILVSHIGARKRAFLDVLINIMAIPAFSMLLWKVAQNAWWSVLNQEKFTSVLMPPIYPLKVAMTIGIGWMILQMTATLIRQLRIVLAKEDVAQP